jgi:hypothetical protein
MDSIIWSGLKWYVKDGGPKGPGGNFWNSANVYVNSHGDLCLRIRNIDGTWQCAEVWTTAALSRGAYQFLVGGHLHALDANVVFGLFNYGTEDGVNEIDIEFGRGLTGDGKPGHYGVWPRTQGGPHPECAFDFTMPHTSLSTHRFLWAKDFVAFQSLRGWPNYQMAQIACWQTKPGFAPQVPCGPIPIHLNLWLRNAQAPTNGKSVLVRIRRLDYVPFDC